MNARTSLWGISSGLESLAPPTRLLLGASLLVGLFATVPSSIDAVVWIILTLSIWVLVLRTPARLVLGIVLGAAFFGSPIFALSAVVGTLGWDARIYDISNGLLHAARILLKGGALTLVALTTLSSLDPSQLQDGMRRLRLPPMLAGLITQILVQTGRLFEETQSMVRAARLRVGSSGPSTAWLLARGIPRMWLPRVMARAERVALAMAIRGFDGRLGLGDPKPAGPADRWAVATALVWLTLSLLLFGWEGR